MAVTLRVVQWTTGSVGRRSVRAITAHPDLELVGCNELHVEFDPITR